MLIRMMKTLAGPDGTKNSGTIYEVDDKIGKGYVEAKIAEPWTRSEPAEQKAEAPKIEKAVKVETSSKRKDVKKKQVRSTKNVKEGDGDES